MLYGISQISTFRQLFSRFAAICAGVFALTSVSNAETFSATDVSFRDVTGTIEIKTTSGDEIDIVIRQGKSFRRVMAEEKDGTVIITGERWKEDDDRNCCDNRINREFHPREGRKLTTGEPVDEGLFADYPTIEILMPYEGNVEFIDARIKLAMERLGGALKLDACYVYGETSDVWGCSRFASCDG